MIEKLNQVKFEPMNEIHNNELIVLNNLLEAIKNRENIEEKFKLFLDDVKHHFEFEQNFMEKYNFFAKVPHKMEHDRVINELESLYLNNYEGLEHYFDNYFIPWLINHINTMDTVTAGYFDMIGAK